MKKILLIKMGYSETLDSETSKIVSLGDVLRCTVVLEPLKKKYPDSELTWLVSKEALPLVSHNDQIDRLLVWDEFIPYTLMLEKYDMVINLEKISGICALTDMIDAWEKRGFRFNSQTGDFDTYLQSQIAKDYIKNKDLHKTVWQKVIIEMIGEEWLGQKYSLGYKPTTKEEYDVGFNFNVGKKWPTKGMPVDKWKELEDKLGLNNYTVTWQEGLDSIYDYIDWINKVKVLISSDSLGLHIALALGKKVIGIFGPTSHEEVYLYDSGKIVNPDNNVVACNCMPCYKPICDNDKFCLEYIDIDKISEYVNEYLKK
jgi:heptosyltransferase-2